MIFALVLGNKMADDLQKRLRELDDELKHRTHKTRRYLDTTKTSPEDRHMNVGMLSAYTEMRKYLQEYFPEVKQ